MEKVKEILDSLSIEDRITLVDYIMKAKADMDNPTTAYTPMYQTLEFLRNLELY